jgi:radical SAM superfamily enzyme YgiQ (UPF0313 family)
MSTNEADALMKKQATDQFIEELAELLNKHSHKVPLGNIIGAIESTKFRLLWCCNQEFDKNNHNTGT